jgi:hypothetical protein
MWGRRASVIAFILSGLAGLAVAPARAGDEASVIVVPSRPGIPVMINGRDASYAVVEGDWGLARPGAVPVTVIGGSPLHPSRAYQPRNSYHPRYGRAPLRGRNEVEPPPDRALPEPAESYSRSWSTSSDVMQPVNNVPPPPRGQSFDPSGVDMVPATINDPLPFNPTIEVVPRNRRRH